MKVQKNKFILKKSPEKLPNKSNAKEPIMPLFISSMNKERFASIIPKITNKNLNPRKPQIKKETQYGIKVSSCSLFADRGGNLESPF